MKKSYFRYIALFVGIIIFVDLIGGQILKTHFESISFGIYGKINNSLKSETEILVLGSSRAMHHYNPDIISKATGFSCYNSGLGGYGLFYNYPVLNERVKKKLPKIVILDLSPNVIIDDKSYMKLNTLLPYYKNYTSFKEILHLDSKFSNLELVSNLYIYNSVIYDFLRSVFENDDNKNSGFVPLDSHMDSLNFTPVYLDNKHFDTNKITYLHKIINLCEEKNIKLIGVISPTYRKFDINNKIINELRDIFESKSLKFYDYSNFSKVYNKQEYFKDQLHLNSKGAEIFSREFAKKIN